MEAGYVSTDERCVWWLRSSLDDLERERAVLRRGKWYHSSYRHLLEFTFLAAFWTSLAVGLRDHEAWFLNVFGSLVSLGSFTYPFVAGREKRYQACVDRVDRLVYLLCVEEEEKLRREVDIAEDSSAVMDSHRRCYSKYIQAVKEYVTAPNDALPVWRY